MAGPWAALRRSRQRIQERRQRDALERRLTAQLAALTPAERKAILAASAYELYHAQGMEGDCDIILKGEPDLDKAYAGGLGHASLFQADDIIILDTLRRRAAIAPKKA